MSSEFGRTLRVGVFGQSHGAAIGVTVDGLPAGERIDLAELQAFLDRRKPGKSPLSTARKEADAPEFLSGLRDGVTCGSPLCAVIYNSDQHSSDYTELADKPRPSHADYTAWVKWGGQADMRGGGHFSGRLTAPLCIAGGIAKQILARHGVFVGAHLAAVGAEDDEAFPLYPTDELFRAVAAKPFPTISDAAGERMQRLILAAREAQDSVGGIVECAAVGLPAGLGDPMFDGIENRLASALFGIPAVKGVEFGAGDRYQVKRITVKPGEGLSVQMHHHRAEHWVVVAGTAKVTIDGDIKLLGENESIYIPLGATHCLENPGIIPLDLIEVRSGSYLEEDDVVRFADRYGRV